MLFSLIGAGAALLVVAVVGIALTPTPSQGAALDMNGNTVILDPGTIPAPEVLKEMKVVEDVGVRFTVPSVDLNVPLGELNEARGTITPPGFASAYLVRNLGVSLDNAAEGTVFVATHSTRGGAVAPGNFLIDKATGASKLANGSLITVGSVTYKVTGWQAISKDAISRNSDVWANTPGRLVVLTCLQLPSQKPSTDNMVIFAELQN